MKNFEKQLINRIRQYPILYDPLYHNYSGQYNRTAAWNEISNDLHVPIQRLKLRWRSLRNCYRLELLKLAENKLSKWQYYDMMTFLSDSIQKKSKYDDLDNVKKIKTLLSDNTKNKSKWDDMDITPESINSDTCETNEIKVTLMDDHIVEPTIKCELDITEPSFNLFNTNSNKNLESELTTFMEAMTKKICSENLNRDQMDALQEQMLILLNRKLREYRQAKK